MRAALEQIVGRLGLSDLGTLGRDTTLQWCVQVFWRLSGVVVLMVLSRKLSAEDIGVLFFALSFAESFIVFASLNLDTVLRGLRVRQRCWPAPGYFCRAGHSASTVVICNYGVQRRTMP